MQEGATPEVPEIETQSDAARFMVDLWFALEALIERHDRLREYVEKECQ